MELNFIGTLEVANIIMQQAIEPSIIYFNKIKAN